MKKTTYKLFNIPILDITYYEDKADIPNSQPKGFVLDDTPDEIKRAEELEILRKYNEK